MDCNERKLYIAIAFCLIAVAFSTTNPNDFKVLDDFRDGLENPELLKWPASGNDPCGPPSWPHVFCSRGRVTQIQVQGLGLKGLLPQNLNQLTELQNLGLQRNEFSGKLPTFNGLSELQFAYLDFNQFDTIPSDFFRGLSSVRVLALDDNPFNVTTGWSIPNDLQDSVQLVNFSCSSCNVVGPVPDFFGKLPSLTSLRLSYNRLSGGIPVSFRDSMLQILWLNDQDGDGMTGPIDVIGSMVLLNQVWLHGNRFTGTIPDDIGALTSLRELNLNGNQLVGPIPLSLASMNLDLLNLNNNMLMGSIPKFKAGNVTYSSNSFCQPIPGLQCAPEVNTLLDFLGSMNYPLNLATLWTGNDPCKEPWLGLSCNPRGEVSIVNLQKLRLNGTISSSIADLNSLMEIHLRGNNLSGPIPSNLTQLKFLRLLDLSGNNFLPPIPKFRNDVKIITDGNPLLETNRTEGPSSPVSSPSPSSPTIIPSPTSPTIIPSPSSPTIIPSPSSPTIIPSPSSLSPSNSSPGRSHSPSSGSPPFPSKGSISGSIQEQSKPRDSNRFKVVVIVVIGAAFLLLVLVVILLFTYSYKKRKASTEVPSSIVVHPRDPSDPDNLVKVAVSNGASGTFFARTGNSSDRGNNGGVENTHMIDAGNLVISVQVLRKATNNFAPENEIGRGGFGAVYKGEPEDGTKIAVKRMESGVVGNKALDEFQAEIAVLSKVRHRHLVSLLGHSVEGNERLLVYEYMPQGALSRHLFHWKSLNLEPLSWTRRLIIALDVARGMEYLHNLAHQSFIHRDLKSSNILLSDDFRAKVSDFGLVKLAPDREKSVATRLAGTFGYLAPEYAVMGRITTKADVFSYGVVLMELLTGLVALDEQRSEENRYLAEWFWQIKSNIEKLTAAIDPTLDAKEETLDSICIVAELAGHCTARDPNHRPDMGHAVNVLAPLVQKWKPFDEEKKEYSGIDYTLPLPQMLRGWQESETKDLSGTSLENSKGSIPAMPAGFAESFTSGDAR